MVAMGCGLIWLPMWIGNSP